MVLYTSDDQRARAEAFIKELDGSGSAGNPVVTQLVELEHFYEAEAEHKDFYLNNPSAMYCQIVISPKVKKVRADFAEDLR